MAKIIITLGDNPSLRAIDLAFDNAKSMYLDFMDGRKASSVTGTVFFTNDELKQERVCGFEIILSDPPPQPIQP